MNKTLQEFQDRVSANISEIWVEEPIDIYYLKNGYSKSGAGIHNQYFTTTVMLCGEVRALGIHIFPDILRFAQTGRFSLSQLQDMIQMMLKVDLGVVSYFGLEQYGAFLQEYYDLIEEFQSIEDFIDVTNEMFTLTNRYQLWLHQIFPWHLSIHFPKADEKQLRDLLEKMNRG